MSKVLRYGHELGSEHPFLVPVARLDWRMHQASRAVDNLLRQDSMKLLETADLDRITIDLAEHCSLLSSRYPLIEIRNLHQDESQDKPPLEVSNEPHRILIMRPQYKVELRYLNEADYQFYLGLKKSSSLASLLEELTTQGFDFPRWMDFAIRHNLIHRFRTL